MWCVLGFLGGDQTPGSLEDFLLLPRLEKVVLVKPASFAHQLRVLRTLEVPSVAVCHFLSRRTRSRSDC
jgi:hypothetical protein